MTRLDDALAILRDLVQEQVKVAPYDYGRKFYPTTTSAGIANDEDGSYCVYCGWVEWEKGRDADGAIHEEDCPIMRGRKLLLGE